MSNLCLFLPPDVVPVVDVAAMSLFRFDDAANVSHLTHVIHTQKCVPSHEYTLQKNKCVFKCFANVSKLNEQRLRCCFCGCCDPCCCPAAAVGVVVGAAAAAALLVADAAVGG